MKKVSIVHANPCGRRTTTALQKHRVKALDGDWNALKQSPRRSVDPAHERNSNRIVQKISGRLIDRTQGLDRDRLEVIVAYFASLREAAISVTQPGDQCKSPRWANLTITSHVKDLPPSKRISMIHCVRRSLDVLAYQANWLFGNWNPSSYESSRNEIVQHVTIYKGGCLQTRLCRPRASTGKPHRQRWGHTSPAQDVNRLPRRLIQQETYLERWSLLITAFLLSSHLTDLSTICSWPGVMI